MKIIAILTAILLSFGKGYAADDLVIPEKMALCIACHGKQGNTDNPQWPNLAGQHKQYLIKQLRDFKGVKTRNVPIMVSFAALLTEQDMQDLATFYSKQPLAEGIVPQKYLKRGEALYRGGDADKGITACIACHSPKGTGNAEAGFPVLSGQHALYTLSQLQAFKRKKRSNDLNHIMQDIAARMDAKDMEAVAYYVQGLH